MTGYRSGTNGISAGLCSVSASVFLLLMLLVYLKLTGAIEIGWTWVFAPLWLFWLAETVGFLVLYGHHIITYRG